MGCDKIAEQLETYINDLSNRIGVDKVNIVAHSMGGLVSSKYIANGNSSKVSKLITYGTPYLGAPKGLYVFETGKFAGVWYKDFVAKGEFKEVSPNFTSAYMLLPSKKYFDSNYGNTYYVRKYYDNTFPQGNDADDVLNFNETNNLINAREWTNKTLLSRTNDFNDSFDIVNTLKSVDSYFFVGDQKTTIGKVELGYSEIGRTNTYKDTGRKDLDPANGDGTVPLVSATIGDKLKDILPNRTFYVNEEHSLLLNNTDVLSQTVSLLNGNNTIAAGSSLRRSRTDTKKLKLRVECPVDLHVFDSENNHVGLISSNEYEEKIKGSSYYTLGDTKIAFLNKDIYNVKLVGTGDGKMTYSLQEYDSEDSLTKTIRFDDVLITPQTIITTNTDIDGEIILNIDNNNDGIVDSALTPSIILDAQKSADIVPPTVSLDILEKNGENGWYTSDVNVKVNASDDNSGINRIQYLLNGSELNTYDGDKISLSKEGINELYVNATDNNRNTCNAAFKEIKIDKTMPVVSINVREKQEFILNELYNVNWSVEDTISGINKYSCNIPNGTALDTSTAGAKTVNVTAVDNAGNKIIKIITYYVRYSYSGIKRPVKPDGSSVFKLGSTIPVKFQLEDISGNYVSNAIANLCVEKIGNGVEGTDIEAKSTSSATTGNLFRYDIADNQYIFNLSTKNLSIGTWKLKIVLNDGTTKETMISLRSN